MVRSPAPYRWRRAPSLRRLPGKLCDAVFIHLHRSFGGGLSRGKLFGLRSERRKICTGVTFRTVKREVEFVVGEFQGLMGKIFLFRSCGQSCQSARGLQWTLVHQRPTRGIGSHDFSTLSVTSTFSVFRRLAQVPR